MSLERDLQLWQQTGNSTHARNIANHLVTVLDQGKYENIDKLKDVTVGHGSGAEIKSGLLWAVIESHEAKNQALRRQNVIMTEALQIIRNNTHRAPTAVELASETLKKVLEGL